MQLYWYEDLPADERMSAAAQVLALEGIWPGDAGHLRFAPEDMVSAEDLSGVASKAAVAADDLGAAPRPRGTLALQLADRLKLL